MKLIIVLIALTAAACAQIVPADKVVIKPGGKLHLGDSIADEIYSGTLVNDSYVSENTLPINPEYLDFDTTQTGVAHKTGRMYFDAARQNWIMYNNRENTSLDVGREGRMRGINTTGSQINNGQVVIISGDSDGIRTIALANASYDSTAIGTIGFATEDIAVSDTGEVALWGEINDINTAGCSAGSLVWLDTIDGGFRSTVVKTPSWQVLLGNCGKADAVNGSINSRVDIRTNTADVLNIFNGAILESHVIDVTSNGTTVQLKLSNGSSQLTLFFDGLPYRFDIPDSINLTAGSDVSPTRNWVYIPKSTKQLTVSTSSFPTSEQFVPICDVLVQSAASVQIYGAYKVHAWTDHLADSYGQGHLSHVNKWIRNQNATWLSGVVPSVTIGTNGAALDTIKWSSTSGQVLQLHSHDFPAVDLQGGDHAHVFNDQTTPYTIINNLGTISTDTEGGSLRANNTYYSLIVWGSVSEDAFDCQLFVNKPSGSYISEASAVTDISNYDIYTIPAVYRGTGFLIARIVIRYQTIGGGTFSIIQTDDLRGLFPSTGAGGGSAPSATGAFADNGFTIYNVSDNTKVIDFDVSGVSTGTTRTITPKNKDLVLATYENASGLNIDAAGSTEYLRLWNSPGSSSVGASNSVVLNPGLESYTFDADSAYNSSNRRFAYIDEVNGLGNYVSGSKETASTVYAPVITSASPAFDGTDNIDYYPIILDTTIGEEHAYIIVLSSTNIANGGTWMVRENTNSSLFAFPTDMAIYYEYSGAFTSTDANYSGYVSVGGGVSTNSAVYLIADDIFEYTQSATAIVNFGIEPVNSVVYTNTTAGGPLGGDLELTIYPHTGGGSGSAIIYIWYKETFE